MARKEVNQKAVTIKKISGNSIETIPIGTEFIITWLGDGVNSNSSCCSGLGITLVWNDEFKLI